MFVSITEDNFSSYTNKKWKLKNFNEREVELICQNFDFDFLSAKLFNIRNIGIEEINSYINPSLKDHMPDPDTLKDMDKSVDRVYQAIIGNEKIAVFGDYDVDGSTSSSIFINYFNHIGIGIDFHIPDRFTEGYGPNISSFQKFINKNVSIIFTLDCGTMAFKEMEFAKQAELDVIIIDHHQPEINLPNAYAIINPNRLDDTSGLNHLAAVGVTFMFLIALNRKLRMSNWFRENNISEPKMISHLDLVALGTVCDVVPLKGLNRLFVLKGIDVINKKQNFGVNALIEKSSIKSKISPYDLGFKLGPRINAAGRLGKSSFGTELLTSKNEIKANEIAAQLDKFNKERKTIESHVLDMANQQVTEEKLKNKVLIVSGENWHEGVIGIIASRLKDKYKKPCLVFSVSNNIAKGSGRSIKGIDLGNLVIAAKQSDIIFHGGGHKMAAGLSLDSDRLNELSNFFEEKLNGKENFSEEEQNYLIADAEISSSGINLEVHDGIELLGPFGSENPEPTFIIKSVLLASVKVLAEEHLKCLIKSPSGNFIEAMAFRSMNSALGEEIQKNKGQTVSLFGKIKVNEWGGRRIPQFFIEDIADQIN